NRCAHFGDANLGSHYCEHRSNPRKVGGQHAGGASLVAFYRLRAGQPHERGEHCSHEPFVGPYASRPGCLFCGHANRRHTLGKLMLGAFILAGGVAGDVYGRRRVLVLGALGMVGASLLAAVAQTGGMLLVARALDGLASAAIGPMALALIAGAFSQAEQARVIGLFLGLSGLGAALGPLGAALVVQTHGWRSGFLMPAAVAALGGFGVLLFAGVVTPVADVILSAVPRERTGSAAA